MKTQKINRSNLKILYDNSCQDWQKIIANLVLFQEGKEIEVEEKLIEKAYNAANSDQKVLLNKYFKIKSNKIIDRVKTWTDVLNELNIKESDILPYSNPKTKEQVSQNAFAKIQAISKVLNEGWIANFSDRNVYKYYPWFEKKASGGWSAGSGLDCLYCAVGGGFGFYYKSSELALYAGNQFLDIYSEYLP